MSIRMLFRPEHFNNSVVAEHRKAFDPIKKTAKPDNRITFPPTTNSEKRPYSTQLSHFEPVSRQPFFKTRSIKESSSFGPSDAHSEQFSEHKNDTEGVYPVLRLDSADLKGSYDMLSRLLTREPNPNKIYDAMGRDALLKMMETSSPKTFDQLVETKKEVEDLTKGKGYVVIGNTGIESAPRELAKLMTITLASVYGFPTCHDGKEIAWPVQENPNAKGARFGGTSDEAPFHTDSQYVPEPEDTFVLTCVKPAKQGGISRLVDGWKLAKQIKEECPEVYSILTDTQFAFRMPTIFTELKRDDIEQIACAPIISPKGIRYRYDTLKLTKLNPEQLGALEIFQKYLSNAPADEHLLKAGQGIIINNRRFLHARTFHGDKNRLLYRVRMNKEQ